MVDFDQLKKISHSTPMSKVLEFYSIESHHSGPDRLKTLCPFHNDTNPSMIVYLNTKDHTDESFYCFACNTGGDVFQFLREMEDDFNQAWTILCEINGIENPDADSLDQLSSLLKDRPSEVQQSLAPINSQISTMYRDLRIELKPLLTKDQLSELSEFIDKRFEMLDRYLDSEPPYAEMYQFYKDELVRFRKIQQHFKNS